MSKSLRILVVEDDPEDALLFKRRCPSDYQVQHVTNEATALETLRHGGIDICFTDYRLGPDNGLDLVRAARTEGLRVPIVVITGQDLEALGENALLAGATDFVPKECLDTTTISRITRWALIRRHVENQREDALTEEGLGQLMGHAPKSQSSKLPSNDDSARALRRVLYLSQARRTFSQQEMLILCSGFAAANARTHVTGVLVSAGNRFMQVMEGEHTVIESLLQRISRDARHGDMAVALDEAVSTRIFSHWNMGSLYLHERYDSSSANWLSVQAKVNRLLSADGITRDSVSQLIRELPVLLGRAASTP